MSSTGRGKERVPNDYYPTPPWVVWRLLDRHFDALLRSVPEAPTILEPTIGDGAILRAVNLWTDDRFGHLMPPDVRPSEALKWTGVELRKDAYSHDGDAPKWLFEGEDFRSWIPPFFCGEHWGMDHPVRWDVSIGNPPFTLAEAILRRVLGMADRVAMLLRLNFLGSEDRIPFWKEFPRPAVRVIPERVSFDGDGTDSDYVAWFIWGTELRDVDILEPTPLAIRNAHKPTTVPVIPQLSLLDLTAD